MIRSFFALVIAFFILMPAGAQGFQRVVFIHNTDKTERVFERGDQLKVVAKNQLGSTVRFTGALVRMTRDSILLTASDGPVKLPMASVTKIQKSGMSGLGWFFLIIGILLLLTGTGVVLFKSGINFIFSPLGVKKKNSLGEILIGLGFVLALTGPSIGHSTVRHPSEKWEINTVITPSQVP